MKKAILVMFFCFAFASTVLASDSTMSHNNLTKEQIAKMKALHKQYPRMTRKQLREAIDNPELLEKWKETKKEKKERKEEHKALREKHREHKEHKEEKEDKSK